MAIEEEGAVWRTRKKHDNPMESSRWHLSKPAAAPELLSSRSTNKLRRPEQPPSSPPKPADARPPPSSAMLTQALSKPERRQSRMSLFDLFSKPKVEKSRGYHETGLSPVVETPPPKPAPSPLVQQHRPDPSTFPSNPRVNRLSRLPAPATQPTMSTSPPHIRTRAPSPSNRFTPTSNPNSSAVFVPQPVQSRTSTPPSQPPSIRLTAPIAEWEPPPLFQAYPQAIKHAKILTTNASIESLIRTHAHRRQYSRSDSRSSFGATGFDMTADGASDTSARRTKRLSSLMTDTSVRLDEKVFVLVTSGYVLQYHGSGPSDRKPEKVLRLGPQSAAFASDLIPGRHWVLQICERVDQSGRNTPGPSAPGQDEKVRGFFKRLGSRAPGKPRSTSLFLMVLESPEEMDEWLRSMRKTIDDLAGRTREPEPGRPQPRETETVPERPTHRFSVIRSSRAASQLPNSKPSPNGSQLTSPVPSQEASPASSPTATIFPHDAGLSRSLTPSKPQNHDVSTGPEQTRAVRQPPPPAAPTNVYSHQSPASAGSSVSTSASTFLSVDPLRESSRQSLTSSRTSEAETDTTSVTITHTAESSPIAPPSREDHTTRMPSTSDEVAALRHPATMRSSYRSSMVHHGPTSNPSSVNWRRSMQALPTTNEATPPLPSTSDQAASAATAERALKSRFARTSIFCPSSGMQPLILAGSVGATDSPLRSLSLSSRRNGSISSTASKASSASSVNKALPPLPAAMTDSFVEANMPAEQREEPIVARMRTPSVGANPSTTGSPSNSTPSPKQTGVVRRASFRPFPVRPSGPTTERTPIPRRNSSLPSMGTQRSVSGPIPLTLVSPRTLQTIPQARPVPASTAPGKPAWDAPKESPTIPPNSSPVAPQSFRRPISLQVRSNHAPFLASRPRNASTSLSGYSSALPPGSTVGPTLSQALPSRSASHSALSSLAEHAISTPGSFSVDRTSGTIDSSTASIVSPRFRPGSITPTSNPRRASALNFSLPYRVSTPTASESPVKSSSPAPDRELTSPPSLTVLAPSPVANGSAAPEAVALPPMKPVPRGPLPAPPPLASQDVTPSPTGMTRIRA